MNYRSRSYSSIGVVVGHWLTDSSIRAMTITHVLIATAIVVRIANADLIVRLILAVCIPIHQQDNPSSLC